MNVKVTLPSRFVGKFFGPPQQKEIGASDGSILHDDGAPVSVEVSFEKETVQAVIGQLLDTWAEGREIRSAGARKQISNTER